VPPRSALICILIAAALALAGARVNLGSGSQTRRSPGQAARAGGFGAQPPGQVRVSRVVDGDTIDVEAGGRRDVVRYIGIDTPESVKPNTPVQCYAKAASHENQRLVEGQTVRLLLDAEPRDRYGRLLAYVYRAGDGLFVNEQLVNRGFARTLRIAPNDHFANRFALLQNHAQSAKRGLWGQC
jgi:micrococcal nuclease